MRKERPTTQSTEVPAKLQYTQSEILAGKPIFIRTASPETWKTAFLSSSSVWSRSFHPQRQCRPSYPVTSSSTHVTPYLSPRQPSNRSFGERPGRQNCSKLEPTALGPGPRGSPPQLPCMSSARLKSNFRNGLPASRNVQGGRQELVRGKSRR